MRGYTAKKGNRYYAVIYEGVDPATGKERRRWYPAGTRKADADKLVTELVKRHNDGEYRAPDRVTLGEYLAEHTNDDDFAKPPGKRSADKAARAGTDEPARAGSGADAPRKRARDTR